VDTEERKDVISGRYNIALTCEKFGDLSIHATYQTNVQILIRVQKNISALHGKVTTPRPFVL
jgi:hypothetical protein